MKKTDVHLLDFDHASILLTHTCRVSYLGLLAPCIIIIIFVQCLGLLAPCIIIICLFLAQVKKTLGIDTRSLLFTCMKRILDYDKCDSRQNNTCTQAQFF